MRAISSEDTHELGRIRLGSPRRPLVRHSELTRLQVTPLGPAILLADDSNAHGADTVAFSRQLKRHIPGPMTVRWDRGNIHDRSRVELAYLGFR